MEEPFIREKPFPEITIADTAFIVDVSFSEIREKDVPENSIPFIIMDVENDKYILYYDKIHKDVDWGKSPDAIRVEIDQMVKLDPENVAKKYGLKINELPALDSQLKCDEALLHKRIVLGQLPVIKIVDEDYFVDIRMGELRSTEAFWKKIELRETNYDEVRYHLFYDQNQRTAVEIDPYISEIPKGVVMVELPNEVWLDPVGSGRKYCGDELQYINQFPLQHGLEARIRPLEKTYIADLVNRNRNRIEETKVTQKTGNRQRKGKRL